MGTIRLSTGKTSSPQEMKKAANEIVLTARSMMPQDKNEAEGWTEPEKSTKHKLTRFSHGMGCACKMRPQDLEMVLKNLPLPENSNILVDTRTSDDACVWKVNKETAWVQSVDFFTPVVDDPFNFGAIAAANAISDLYAMGATPLFALNIVAFPVTRLPLSVLNTILDGARSVADEAGIYILGGHSIEDKELKYGMVVSGQVHPEKILRNSGAIPGDKLILTKPIGTGILTTALKKGKIRKEWEEPLIRSMAGLNKTPASLFPDFNIHAVTDITGFGLLGHMNEMLRASNVSAVIHMNHIPVFDGVFESIEAGLVPGGSMQNLEFINPHVKWAGTVSRERKILLADAQTSGGLLISVPGKEAEAYLNRVKKEGCLDAEIIGEIRKPGERSIIVE